MAGRGELQDGLFQDSGHFGFQGAAEPGAGIAEIQGGHRLLIGQQDLFLGFYLGCEFAENAEDFTLFFLPEQLELIIERHHGLGLDEEGGAASTLALHDAGHVGGSAFAHGEDIAVVASGYEFILEIAFEAGVAQHSLHGLHDPALKRSLAFADARKLRRGGIKHLALGIENAVETLANPIQGGDFQPEAAQGGKGFQGGGRGGYPTGKAGVEPNEMKFLVGKEGILGFAEEGAKVGQVAEILFQAVFQAFLKLAHQAQRGLDGLFIGQGRESGSEVLSQLAVAADGHLFRQPGVFQVRVKLGGVHFPVWVWLLSFLSFALICWNRSRSSNLRTVKRSSLKVSTAT
ncbi:MAG: hypothetical protein BWX83_01209 [Candidatus Cloacimonetes bacterium ADurb.Bin117]|nr:MAG: hypothetical protein BWX83_01209 [Candidatus Cloacimonetes bacterium ADurb.Bin117]